MLHKASQRFNLLLLDEGEYYFEDYSAFYYPAGNDEEALKKKVKGRLKLCSNSLIFEPDEMKLSIVKYPFRYIQQIQKWFTLTSKISSKADVFSVKINMTVRMKENNVNAPYIFSEENEEHRFSLNYTNLSSFLTRTNELLSISRLPSQIAEERLKEIIEERENSIHFDTSNLENLNEKILIEVTAICVTPLANNPGKILITNSIIYFQAFNNIDINPVQKFRLEEVSHLSKKRYVLRNVGLELVFESIDTSVFFAFKSPELRDLIFSILIKQPVISNLSSLSSQTNMTLKWQSGLISNYDYLLYLNDIAGRTFNDLTQYPVFPWILSDYMSQELDLENPKIYRDLSKPIGALNPDRLHLFRERMQQIPESQSKFLYGTHYSTPGYVLFYLVRESIFKASHSSVRNKLIYLFKYYLEPEYMLRLQNGKFDAPGRLFHSILETWTGVLENQADVKELIPEFYDVSKKGSFLLNKEHLNLGTRENGERVDDVILPPWAKNPEDFIKKMRDALESDYISQNLHHWIDLIFGYKQQGEQALEANNVFYHLTYEGAVNIDEIRDPVEKASIIAQIKEFGQTPKQIFNAPHPQRLTKSQRHLSLNEIEELSSSLNKQTNLVMTPSWDSLNDLKFNHSFKLHKDIIGDLCLSANESTLYSVSQDTTLKIYSITERRQLRSISVSDLALSSCELAIDEKTVVVGSWDNNIYIYSIEYGRILDTVSAHDDAISCIKLYKNDLLVSCSWDASVKVWKYTSSEINKVPIAEFIDSETGIYCADIDSQGNLIVTGDKEGTIVLHDLRTKKQIRNLPLHLDSINSVQFSPDSNRILSCSNDGHLRVTEIGGSELLTADLKNPLKALRTNGDIVACGGDSGIVHLWDLKNGQQIKNLIAESNNSGITSLIVGSEGTILVTGGQSIITVFSK